VFSVDCCVDRPRTGSNGPRPGRPADGARHPHFPRRPGERLQARQTPESIHDAYETVALADVYAILAYYLRHRAEVEAYLAEQESEGAEIQVRIEANDPPEGLRARLLARLES
jgi:hypothetical protein